VKDCARAIALVQTASVLRHRIYNIGSGGAVRNRDFVAIVRRVFPDAGIPAAHESDGAPVLTSLDITRIRDDAGYTPRFDAEEGISDYIAWLQRGHSY
jgi:UDP-glucose 4-epimerase